MVFFLTLPQLGCHLTLYTSGFNPWFQVSAHSVKSGEVGLHAHTFIYKKAFRGSICQVAEFPLYHLFLNICFLSAN